MVKIIHSVEKKYTITSDSIVASSFGVLYLINTDMYDVITNHGEIPSVGLVPYSAVKMACAERQTPTLDLSFENHEFKIPERLVKNVEDIKRWEKSQASSHCIIATMYMHTVHTTTLIKAPS